MNQTVRLREEADRDLAAAASWYEQQREGLGHEFLDEALAAFKLVAEQPLIAGKVAHNRPLYAARETHARDGWR